jgi:hypothetical protein
MKGPHRASLRTKWAIELIQVGRRHRVRHPARPQVFRVDIRTVGMHLDLAPLPPLAFMAPIRLVSRHLLTEPLEPGTQSRGIHPRRATSGADHEGPRRKTCRSYHKTLSPSRASEALSDAESVVLGRLGWRAGQEARQLDNWEGQRPLILMPPFVPSSSILGPPPFSRPSSRRRDDSPVVSICRPLVSMPPLVMRADTVALASFGS